MRATRTFRPLLKAAGFPVPDEPAPLSSYIPAPPSSEEEAKWMKQMEAAKATQDAHRKEQAAYRAARITCDWCDFTALRDDAAEGWDEYYCPPLSYEFATVCPGCREAFKAVEQRRHPDD